MTERVAKRRKDTPRGKLSDKIDELFTRWINLPETQDKIERALNCAKSGIDPNIALRGIMQAEKNVPISPRPPSPTSLPSPRSEGIRRSNSLSSAEHRLHTPRHSSSTPDEPGPPSVGHIPQFYFPLGMPRQSDGKEALNLHVTELNRIFPPNGGSLDHCGRFCQRVGLPVTWRSLLAYSAHRDQNLGVFNEQGVLVKDIPAAAIEELWRSVYHYTREEALFIRLVAGEGNEMYLDDDGLLLFVLDLIQTVPSLKFLQLSKDFHIPYGKTVIQRLGYCAHAWTNRIRCRALRQTGFLQAVELITSPGGDVNAELDFFSYEHFYVIYCKFWELDTHHVMSLTPSELMRYGDGAINAKVYERLGHATCRYRKDKMDYNDFIWFILAEEDKTNAMSHEYWFKVLDQDGDGLISLFDLQQFYMEQLIKLKSFNIEPISFEDKLDDVLDRWAAATHSQPTTLAKGIGLRTLKSAKEVAQPILDTFINVEKYILSDQSEMQDPSPDQIDTPWQRFAAETYRALLEDDPDQVDDQRDELYDNFTAGDGAYLL